VGLGADHDPFPGHRTTPFPICSVQAKQSRSCFRPPPCGVRPRHRRPVPWLRLTPQSPGALGPHPRPLFANLPSHYLPQPPDDRHVHRSAHQAARMRATPRGTLVPGLQIPQLASPPHPLPIAATTAFPSLPRSPSLVQGRHGLATLRLRWSRPRCRCDTVVAAPRRHRGAPSTPSLRHNDPVAHGTPALLHGVRVSIVVPTNGNAREHHNHVLSAASTSGEPSSMAKSFLLYLLRHCP
jgi:hypothetical protein